MLSTGLCSLLLLLTTQFLTLVCGDSNLRGVDYEELLTWKKPFAFHCSDGLRNCRNQISNHVMESLNHVLEDAWTDFSEQIFPMEKSVVTNTVDRNDFSVEYDLRNNKIKLDRTAGLDAAEWAYVRSSPLREVARLYNGSLFVLSTAQVPRLYRLDPTRMENSEVTWVATVAAGTQQLGHGVDGIKDGVVSSHSRLPIMTSVHVDSRDKIFLMGPATVWELRGNELLTVVGGPTFGSRDNLPAVNNGVLRFPVALASHYNPREDSYQDPELFIAEQFARRIRHVYHGFISTLVDSNAGIGSVNQMSVDLNGKTLYVAQRGDIPLLRVDLSSRMTRPLLLATVPQPSSLSPQLLSSAHRRITLQTELLLSFGTLTGIIGREDRGDILFTTPSGLFRYDLQSLKVEVLYATPAGGRAMNITEILDLRYDSNDIIPLEFSRLDKSADGTILAPDSRQPVVFRWID